MSENKIIMQMIIKNVIHDDTFPIYRYILMLQFNCFDSFTGTRIINNPLEIATLYKLYILPYNKSVGRSI